MVTYAQTNGATIAATNLNNAFREEVANAGVAWSSKYKHLWRFILRCTNFGSATPTVQCRRYFYAPDDMFLVGLSGRIENSSGATREYTTKFVGDTEAVNSEASTITVTTSVAAGFSGEISRPSLDAATDEKFFLRKGALYYLECTTNGGTNGQYASITATFALAKRST